MDINNATTARSSIIYCITCLLHSYTQRDPQLYACLCFKDWSNFNIFLLSGSSLTTAFGTHTYAVIHTSFFSQDYRCSVSERYGNASRSCGSARGEVIFSRLSLNRDYSQDRSPLKGQRKQPWALWSLINNFHPAITLPDSPQLNGHQKTLSRETGTQAGNRQRQVRERQKASRRSKRTRDGYMRFWKRSKKEAINIKSSFYPSETKRYHASDHDQQLTKGTFAKWWHGQTYSRL